MRMIVRFAKYQGVRFLSHLDLQRALQRGLRRSGLEIAYSKGFNPHPILSLATALPVGMSSVDEYMDVRMAGDCTPESFISAFNAAMPPDIQALAARAVGDDYPTLTARLVAAEYRVSAWGLPQADYDAPLAQRLAEPPFIAVRKTKGGEQSVDLCRVVLGHQIDSDAEKTVFSLKLAAVDGALLRPDVVVGALCALLEFDCSDVLQIPERTALYAMRGGKICSPLDL